MKKNTNVTKLMSSIALAGALVSSANANDSPNASPMGGWTSAGENTPLYFGFDREDGTNVAVNIINAPANGVIENISGNTGIYRANTNYSGFDGFSFYVMDSQGKKSTNSATFLIKPNNIAPEVQSFSRVNGTNTIELKIQPEMNGKRITRVLKNTDLSNTNGWQIIGNVVPSSYVPNGLVSAQFIDNNSTNTQAFYRLRTDMIE